jgi:signal transduction histidine kinase
MCFYVGIARTPPAGYPKTAMARILIIDDDPTSRAATAALFTAAGHEVVEAAEGAEALDLIGMKGFDAVFTELNLPGGAGLEVIQQAHALEPDLPMAVLTGYATIEQAIRAQQQGATAFIAKPPAPEELRQRLERFRGEESPRTVSAMTLGTSLETLLRLVCHELAATSGEAFIADDHGTLLQRAAWGIQQPNGFISRARSAPKTPQRDGHTIHCPVPGWEPSFLRLHRNETDKPFIDHDLQVLTRAAQDAAAAIRNAHAYSDLAEEKRKLQTIFERSQDLIIVAGPDGSLRLANPLARTLLDFADRKPETIHEAFAGFDPQPVPEVLDGIGGDLLACEFRRKGAKRLILNGVRSRLKTHDGHCDGHLYMLRDMTQEFREEIATRNVISLISHKLRTPLGIIIGNHSLLSNGALPETIRTNAVEAIGKQADKLRYYVDKAVLLAGVQFPEALEIRRDDCEPRRLLTQAFQGMTSLAEERGIKLELDIPDKLPSLNADAAQITNAIQNLIENALKFHNKKAGHVKVHAEQGATNLRLSVTDDGPGIAPEDRPHLFKQLWQVDDDFTGQIEGLGLGLAYAKHVAEGHDGRLGFETEVGSGSTFFMEFPLAEQKNEG